MDPGTAMLLMTVANVASEGMQGLQQYQQGKYEAEVAGQNARIAMDNAARARLDAARAEEAQRRESRKSLGRSAAAASQSGAAGRGPGQGSAGDVLGQASKEAELDALNIRYGGEMEAFGQETQAAQFRAERKIAIQRAKGAALSGVLGMASSGLSGYSNYRVAQAQGQFGAPKTPTAPQSKPSAAPNAYRRSSSPRHGAVR